MLDKEELLYNELYEKTKDCGRTQFIRLLMEKEREIQEVKEQLDDPWKGYSELQEENEKLLSRIRDLKKQLEECYCNRTDCSSRIKDSKKYDSLVQVQETQQKKFIKYLEDEIQKKGEKSTTLTAFIRNVVPLQQCLQKYKEIMGGNKNESN
mgnify:CR=1 FL=1